LNPEQRVTTVMSLLKKEQEKNTVGTAELYETEMILIESLGYIRMI